MFVCFIKLNNCITYISGSPQMRLGMERGLNLDTRLSKNAFKWTKPTKFGFKGKRSNTVSEINSVYKLQITL